MRRSTFSLARRQQVEFGIEARVDVRRKRGEGVEDETCQTRREDSVAFGDPMHGFDELGPCDRLGDVTAHARADHRDDVLGGVGNGEREEAHLGVVTMQGSHDSCATPSRQMDVDQNDVRQTFGDELNRRFDIVGFADDVDCCPELGAHASKKERVVVDEENPRSTQWCSVIGASFSARPRSPRPDCCG